MGWTGWITLCGVLLLCMALSSAYRRELPVSAGLIYLAVGLAVSPVGVDWLHVDVRDDGWLERLAEVAVVVSLFFGGLKLRLSFRNPAWVPVLVMAGPLMLVTIALVAVVGHFLLGLDVAMSLLLGAVLAPTDPVLANAVSVNSAADHDRVRFGLSGEAGLNDGMAFPFLIFALEWGAHGGPGAWIATWALERLLWAVPAALLLGYFLGKSAGRLAIALRSRHADATSPSDFLALSLIALSYAFAEAISAWGFLAVFAAGVGLRGAESKVVDQTPHPESDAAATHPPAEHLVGVNVSADSLKHPAIAAGVLVSQTISFGDTAERLLEVTLVVLLGIGLATHCDLRGVALGLALLVILRPLAARLLLSASPISNAQRWVMGWFGIRGIGSIYYLCYALRHGVPETAAEELSALVLPVLALSVVVHGMTAHPLLAHYERVLARAARPRGAVGD
jgi:sodium/hydrogen antiporter